MFTKGMGKMRVPSIQTYTPQKHELFIFCFIKYAPYKNAFHTDVTLFLS